MVFFAIALICIGLIFLGFYFYLQKLEHPYMPTQQPTQMELNPKHLVGERKIIDPSTLNQASPRLKKETKRPFHNTKTKSNPLKTPSPLNQKVKDFKQAVDRISSVSEVSSKPISSSQTIPKNNSQSIPVLNIKGFLYLDPTRLLKDLNQQNSEIPDDFFQTLTRVGEGSLSASRGHFTITCSNASWDYPTLDLEQIIFQKAGLVVVTKEKQLPIALFLTEEASLLRKYIKNAA